MDGQQGLSIVVLKSRLSEQHFNTKSYTLFFLPRRRDHSDSGEYVGMVTLRTVLNQEAELISKDPAVFRVPVDAVTAMQRVSTLGFRPVTACVEPPTVENGQGLHVWTMASGTGGSGGGPNETLESSAVLHAMAAQHQRLSAQAKYKESAAALLVNSNATSAELPNEDGNLPVNDETVTGGRNSFVSNVAAEAALRSQRRRLFPNVENGSPNDSATNIIMMDGISFGGNNRQNYGSGDDDQQTFADEEEYENEGIEGDDEQLPIERRENTHSVLSFNNHNNNFTSKSTASLTKAALHKSAQLSMSYRYHRQPHTSDTVPKSILNGIGRGGASSGKRRGRPPLPRDASGHIIRPVTQRPRKSQTLSAGVSSTQLIEQPNGPAATGNSDAAIRPQHAPTGSATQITDATGVTPQTFVKRSRGRPRKDGTISPQKLLTGRIAAVVTAAAAAGQPFVSMPAPSIDTTEVATAITTGSGTAANSAAPSTAAASTDDLLS